MRLGIFRRFSYLIHRRTRSDSAILSGDHLHQQRTESIPIIDSILPPALPMSPFILSPLAPHQTSPCTASPALATPAVIDSQDNIMHRLSVAQKHATELATQSSQLKASIEALQVETGYIEGAVEKAKSELYQTRSLANSQKRRSMELESQINARKHELAQCEAFTDALSGAGLVELATVHAATTCEFKTREMFEDLVVDAIREASANDTGIWSKIVSLVVGPSAPDNYVNAINMTLHSRQEMQHWKKVSNFWKKIAKRDKPDAPTPSSSNLSDVQEALSDERKKAVEELRERRKALGLNAFKASTSAGTLNSSDESVTLPYRLADSHPSFTSVMSNLVSSRDGSSTNSVQRLAPLASDMFKQELFSSHSSRRLFSSSPPKGLRSSQSHKLSEKALGKRKAVDIHDVVPSVPSVAFSFDSNDVQVGSSLASSSIDPISSLTSFNSETPPPPPQLQVTSNSESDSGVPPVYNSLKSAERALESFERICNRFSSGSNIGSLQSISEESSLVIVTTATDNAQEAVLNQSESLSNRFDVLQSTGNSSVRVASGSVFIHEGDATLVESGSEASKHALDRTLIEEEGANGNKDCLDIQVEDTTQGSSLLKKSRLPIFRIPDRLSQLSKITGSSSKKSLASSIQSRNSSSTIATVVSRDNNNTRSGKSLGAFKPILPLRIIKKGGQIF